MYLSSYGIESEMLFIGFFFCGRKKKIYGASKIKFKEILDNNLIALLMSESEFTSFISKN